MGSATTNTETYDHEKHLLGKELDAYGRAIDEQTRLPADHDRLLEEINDDILLSGNAEKLGAHVEALERLVK